MERKGDLDKNLLAEGDSETTRAEASASPTASANFTAATSASLSATTTLPMDDVTIAEAMQAVETLTAIYGFSEDAASEAVHYITSHSKRKNGDSLVALCCDFILDNGLGIDAGGAIAPIDNCPHVVIDDEKSETHPSLGSKTVCCVSITANDVPENIFDATCKYYEESKDQVWKPTGGFKDDTEYSEKGGATCPKGENWWCLQCGGIYCSRYVNGHGVKHFEEQQQQQQQHNKKEEHCVMVGLADLSVWCHICGAYLETHHNQRLSSILQRLQDIKFRDE